MTFTSSDAAKSVNITANPLDVTDAPIMALYRVLDSFNALAPLSTVAADATTTTYTLKDGRIVTYTLNFGATPPSSITFKVDSISFWSTSEFAVVQSLSQIITTLQLQYAMTAMSVTYN